MSTVTRNRKDDILRAAAGLFVRQGYHQTSMQQIADEVGILKGSLYHHFRGKQEILVAVSEEPLTRLVGDVERVAGNGNAGVDQVRSAIELHVEALVRGYPYLTIVTAESDDALPDGIRDLIVGLRLRYQRAWEHIIETGQRDGSLRPIGKPGVLVNFTLGSINWMHRWYRPSGALGAEELANTLASMFLDGMAAQPERESKQHN